MSEIFHGAIVSLCVFAAVAICVSSVIVTIVAVFRDFDDTKEEEGANDGNNK